MALDTDDRIRMAGIIRRTDKSFIKASSLTSVLQMKIFQYVCFKIHLRQKLREDLDEKKTAEEMGFDEEIKFSSFTPLYTFIHLQLTKSIETGSGPVHHRGSGVLHFFCKGRVVFKA